MGYRGRLKPECHGGSSLRKAGTEAWRRALPLLRIGGEQIYRMRENMTYTVPEGFAGSIFNLEPATS
jgi:hypothetical protein